ncbi:arrestin domain-containing protein 17-like isoform X2 [Bradysia coprophila]|uniref:arrestin domain-containing protein 17-like isoform X2 n=1 Tax=Bradysia coprophila TaxID=38358 RepID=UPI00187DCE8C|nr:arrestin domain-containing protein 17-like isoform X2 [Bradysia coprophila]
MVINCEIKFDQNPYGIYFAGQTLSGRAELRLAKPKKVKGIRILIYGQSKTSWCETESHFENGKPRSKDIFYSADEVYLDAKAYLLGVGDNGNQLELSAGHHSYSFSCELPAHLPTSYEGTYGHIRYTVRLVLERPWKFDQSYKVAFTVLKPFDLNYDSPILRIPSQMELNKNFCCGPCRTGPFSIVASIPQSGFVSGQIISVSAEVTNMSTIPVDEMKFVLRKIVSYHSQTPTSKTKEEIVDIQERRVGGVSKNDHGRFLVSLPVPPVPPTNVNLCKVIHIMYEIKIEARLSGLHQNPYIRIPITIGTIPLNHSYPDPKYPTINTVSQPPITVQPVMNTLTQQEMIEAHDRASNDVPPTATNDASTIPTISTEGGATEQLTNIPNRTPIINPITDSGLRSSYQEMPPPSYEETVGGHRRIDDDEQHPIGHQLYAPRYPVYNFNGGGTSQMATESNSSGSGQRTAPSPEKILEKMEMI